MKVVAQNRRARYDYEILETIEAGIILSGQEVKSCRMSHVNLSGAYVSFLRGKPILKHAKISPYASAGNLPDYNPERDRELLIKKGEREKLETQMEEKGMTIVPLEVRAGKFIKVLLAVVRGKKKLDKRQTIKERDIARRVREGREI